MGDKPLRRSKQLQPLSREHHSGLLFCWKLRQGIKGGVDMRRMVPYVEFFWSTNLQHHFKEEETLIFLDKSDALIARALSEHGLIEEQIQHIIHDSEAVLPQQIHALIRQMDDHIRFEERVLFPYLENTLNESRLKAVGDLLEQHKNGMLQEDYPDAFWGK